MQRLNQDEKFQLIADRERAKRVMEFLDSRFWKEDIGPFLQGESERKTMPPINPMVNDQLNIENVSLKYAFNSGMLNMCDRIRGEMQVWLQRGEQAVAKLRREAEFEEREQRLKQTA